MLRAIRDAVFVRYGIWLWSDAPPRTGMPIVDDTLQRIHRMTEIRMGTQVEPH